MIPSIIVESLVVPKKSTCIMGNRFAGTKRIMEQIIRAQTRTMEFGFLKWSSALHLGQTEK